jgi:uncharacterized protein
MLARRRELASIRPMAREQVLPGVWLDSRRAVFFEELSLLAVADLHWGYAQSHRASGNLLPLWGDERIARELDELAAQYRPTEMLWLGDSLHDLNGKASAERYLRNAPCQVTLILGNHDARWDVGRDHEAKRGRFLFHHGNRTPAIADDAVEVIGHFHPAFDWWDGAGARMKLPALVQGERRLILPAFSPWAAGAPWTGQLRDDEKLWVISPKRVFAVTNAMMRRR